MPEEKKTAVLLSPDDWTVPQLGTPAQHKALVKRCKELGFISIKEMLNDWEGYRNPKPGLYQNPDELSKDEANRVFQHLRANLTGILQRMTKRGR